jgi:ElaB/YqjD/DUF883 family membrane-anchored ribosome-binding protein
MERDDNMAEPVRKDEPLSSMRFPDSPSSTGNARPGPVPVERITQSTPSEPLVSGGIGSETIEPDHQLPEQATSKPLGEWPQSSQRSNRDLDPADFSGTTTSVNDTLNNVVSVVVDRAKQIPGFMSDRMVDLKRKFRVVRGQVESGELQGEIKDRASELADEASAKARYARSRAEFYARNYPLQFIAGAAAVGFVVGFLLRLGRDE